METTIIGGEIEGSFTVDWNPSASDPLLAFLHPDQRRWANATFTLGKWFAPTITLLDAGVVDMHEVSDNEKTVVIGVTLSGGDVKIEFARWWYRPVWWVYTRWQKFIKRLSK